MSARRLAVFLGLCLLLAGCAAGANELVGTANAQGDTPGFWRGLWHGMLAPITFLVSLFTHEVRVYEVHNGGSWYDFGFVLGLSMSFGGSGARTFWGRKKKL